MQMHEFKQKYPIVRKTNKKPDWSRARTARRTLDELNARVDARLALIEPAGMRLMLTFVRRFVMPLCIDCRDIVTELLLIDDGAWVTDKLTFNTCKTVVQETGITIETTTAVPSPAGWQWGTKKEQEILPQIYANLRTIDILIDDIARACNTELQAVWNNPDTANTIKDIRLFSADERRQKVDFIKSVSADYWHTVYSQISRELEDKREISHAINKFQDARERLANCWYHYCQRVSSGQIVRRMDVETEALQRAGEVGPRDILGRIQGDIETMDTSEDRVNSATTEEVI